LNELGHHHNLFLGSKIIQKSHLTGPLEVSCVAFPIAPTYTEMDRHG